MKIGFDNDKYVKLQSERIRERIKEFDNKLYLEFGGKLYDDFHASRVLPGFEPDSKLKMLLELKDQTEMILVIGADAIEANKVRGDLGITYDEDLLRLIDIFKNMGFYVGGVVITKYAGQPSVDKYRLRLKNLGIESYLHYPIPGYPSNVPLIVSDEGYGRNEYIKTTRPLVVVTAPGPGSGKMATCLSQLYHEHKRGVRAGYAKFETFPVWNLPLNHPVNQAYEAATIDLNDVNMIDPFHLQAYGETTVNYNRDIEIFPVLNAILTQIMGKSPYKSPTDMGVNMIQKCIVNDEVCAEASRQEIIRRYFQALIDKKKGLITNEMVLKMEYLMSQADISVDNRKVVEAARKREEETGKPAVAIELDDGTIITGKTTSLLGPSSAAILKCLKHFAGIEKDVKVVAPSAIEPIQGLKTEYLGSKNPRLHTDEILIALCVSASENETAKLTVNQIPKLKGCEVHSTCLLSSVDIKMFKKLGMHLTCDV